MGGCFRYLLLLLRGRSLFARSRFVRLGDLFSGTGIDFSRGHLGC